MKQKSGTDLNFFIKFLSADLQRITTGHPFVSKVVPIVSFNSLELILFIALGMSWALFYQVVEVVQPLQIHTLKFMLGNVSSS